MKRKTLGFTAAATAAIVFAAAPVVSTVAYAAHKMPCYGVNACKGKSACKTANNECKGHNACKGKGMMMKTASQCKKMGGSETEKTS